MKYPKILRNDATIGICAPSFGVTGRYSDRLDNAISQLSQLGFKFIETKSVRQNIKLASTTNKKRAEEFMELYLNDEVDVIYPPAGGEILLDLLPYLDYEIIKAKRPKWIIGFSDISTLLFCLTLKCDLATVHGPTLLSFGATPIYESDLNLLKVLQTTKFEQKNLKYYQNSWNDINQDTFYTYKLTEKVAWKILNGTTCQFQGRLIGGCLDVVRELIGTEFAPVEAYIEKYKSDQIIWFLESFETSAAELYRTLWQMKMNHYFENCAGFVFGRPNDYHDTDDFTFTDALTAALGDLEVPILYDIDLGHKEPQLTFINGAIATVIYKDNQGKIIQELK